MDLKQIEQMVEDYQMALERELSAKAKLAEETEGLEKYKAGLIAMSYADGTIDGKNERARKVQEAQVLLEDEDITELEADISDWAEVVRSKECERKAQEAYLGLVKAWLYSQARIG